MDTHKGDLFEKAFHDRLAGLESSPPDGAWSAISQQIAPTPRYKTKPLIWWSLIGAVLIGVNFEPQFSHQRDNDRYIQEETSLPNQHDPYLDDLGQSLDLSTSAQIAGLIPFSSPEHPDGVGNRRKAIADAAVQVTQAYASPNHQSSSLPSARSTASLTDEAHPVSSSIFAAPPHTKKANPRQTSNSTFSNKITGSVGSDDGEAPPTTYTSTQAKSPSLNEMMPQSPIRPAAPTTQSGSSSDLSSYPVVQTVISSQAQGLQIPAPLSLPAANMPLQMPQNSYLPKYPTNQLYLNASFMPFASIQQITPQRNDLLILDQAQALTVTSGYKASLRLEKPFGNHVYGFAGLGYQQIRMGQQIGYTEALPSGFTGNPDGNSSIITPTFERGELAMPSEINQTSLHAGLRIYLMDQMWRGKQKNAAVHTTRFRQSITTSIGMANTWANLPNATDQSAQLDLMRSTTWEANIGYTLHFHLSRSFTLMTGPTWIQPLSPLTHTNAPLALRSSQIALEFGLGWKLK